MKNISFLFFFIYIITGCNRALEQRQTYLPQIVLNEIKKDSTINIWGLVKDGETGEALPFANIVIFKGEDLITGRQTDLNGIYRFTEVEAGTYNFEVTYSGYTSQKITDVVIYGNRKNKLDFHLETEQFQQCVIEWRYKIPLLRQDETTSGHSFSSEFIKKTAF